MFGNGGSDAVEGALKIARQYHKLRGPGRPQQVHQPAPGLPRRAFRRHERQRQHQLPPRLRAAAARLLPRRHALAVPQPYTDDPVELGRICAELLEREIVFQGPDTVAAFIAEPVQGAGGVIVPPPNYWPLVREVCDRHGVLLIADEVVTGFGRTGALFGTRLWGVKADMWCLAKGISSGYVPLGATAIGRRVAEVFDADTSRRRQVTHGYTYSAHPVAAAAALATLKTAGGSTTCPATRRASAPHFQARLRGLRRSVHALRRRRARPSA
jgi:putrescine aminotransferase